MPQCSPMFQRPPNPNQYPGTLSNATPCKHITLKKLKYTQEECRAPLQHPNTYPWCHPSKTRTIRHPPIHPGAHSGGSGGQPPMPQCSPHVPYRPQPPPIPSCTFQRQSFQTHSIKHPGVQSISSAAAMEHLMQSKHVHSCASCTVIVG